MTPTDATLLEVVAAHINRPRDGRMETAMTEATGLSPTRAWQRINRLLEDPDAWAAHPLTLGTLRRRQSRRAAA